MSAPRVDVPRCPEKHHGVTMVTEVVQNDPSPPDQVPEARPTIDAPAPPKVAVGGSRRARRAPSRPFLLQPPAAREPVFALCFDEGRCYWSAWRSWRECKAGEAPAAWGVEDDRMSAVRAARRSVRNAVRLDDAIARPWTTLLPASVWHVLHDDRGELRSCRHATVSSDDDVVSYLACCGGGSELLARLPAADLRQRRMAVGACFVETLPGLLLRVRTLFHREDPLARTAR